MRKLLPLPSEILLWAPRFSIGFYNHYHNTAHLYYEQVNFFFFFRNKRKKVMFRDSIDKSPSDITDPIAWLLIEWTTTRVMRGANTLLRKCSTYRYRYVICWDFSKIIQFIFFFDIYINHPALILIFLVSFYDGRFSISG